MRIEGELDNINVTFPIYDNGEIILFTTEDKECGAYRETLRRTYSLKTSLFLELLNIGLRVKENELKERKFKNEYNRKD